MVRLRRFEVLTFGSGDQRQMYILLVRSVLSRTWTYANVPYSAIIFPKSFQSFSSPTQKQRLSAEFRDCCVSTPPALEWASSCRCAAPMLKTTAKILGSIFVAAVLVLTGTYIHYDQENTSIDDRVRRSFGASFVHLRDGSVHYELSGPKDGRTVVLVHGFSVPYYIWDPTFDALVKAGFRVLRYDLYGRGYSDRPDVVYDADLFDRQLSDLMAALDIRDPVDLVGVSMGGPIVITFADRHPEKVRTISLIDPAYRTGKRLAFKLRAPLVGEYVMDVFIAPSLPQSQMEDFYRPERFPEYADKYRPQVRYKGFRRALLSTRRNYSVRDDRQEYQDVGRSGLPVLLIWGKVDRAIPFSVSQEVLNALPHAEFYPIEEAAHIPHYERPETVNPILIRFLSK